MVEKASHPYDYVTRDQIQDLWGIGYTIVKRDCGRLDTFELPNGAIPAGRSYQWWHLVQDRVLFEREGSGWAPVPASRHDGWFMPFGHVGPIEVSGLGLFEKSKVEVDAEKSYQVAAAHQQVADWANQVAEDFGLSGAVKVGVDTIEVGDSKKVFKSAPNKTIDTTVGIPRDMTPHIASIFKERDELYEDLIKRWDMGTLLDWQIEVYDKYQAALEEDPSILKGPTINALLLPRAIHNVRTILNHPMPMLDKLKAKAAEYAAQDKAAKLKEGKSDE